VLNQRDTGSSKLSANAITAHLAATFAGLPVYVHTIEHVDGVVLVDTGMIDSTPELDEEGAPVPMPENIPREVVCVINTHLHFDHCGGNRLFPGVPRDFLARTTRSDERTLAPAQATGLCSHLMRDPAFARSSTPSSVRERRGSHSQQTVCPASMRHISKPDLSERL
jgi:glyoxylase-like metal-dependent hydrolase (beta-lactamase superfamily II)